MKDPETEGSSAWSPLVGVVERPVLIPVSKWISPFGHNANPEPLALVNRTVLVHSNGK